MNKKSLLYILLDLIFLAVFNTVFFVIGGTEHPASVWISYGFIHFSYLMILVTPFLIRKSSSAAVFGFSLYSVSAVYFFVEFIVGLVFIFIGSESYKVSLVVQIIIAGFYAIMLISNLIANEYTADSIKSREDEAAYIRDITYRLKALIGKATDKQANREIEKAYDAVRSSPIRSNPTVKCLEQLIRDKVSELEVVAETNDTTAITKISNEIIVATEDRNKMLKLYN